MTVAMFKSIFVSVGLCDCIRVLCVHSRNYAQERTTDAQPFSTSVQKSVATLHSYKGTLIVHHSFLRLSEQRGIHYLGHGSGNI